MTINKDDVKTDNIICDPSKLVFSFEVNTLEFEFLLTVCKNKKYLEIVYTSDFFNESFIIYITKF